MPYFFDLSLKSSCPGWYPVTIFLSDLFQIIWSSLNSWWGFLNLFFDLSPVNLISYVLLEQSVVPFSILFRIRLAISLGVSSTCRYGGVALTIGDSVRCHVFSFFSFVGVDDFLYLVTLVKINGWPVVFFNL